jgi:hypothetical protein
LPKLGAEAVGYGLYSYAILPSPSPRDAQFLSEVFRSTPAVENTRIEHDRLNLLHLPIKAGLQPQFEQQRQRRDGDWDGLGADYARNFYDHTMARAILAHVCGLPADEVRELCQSDVMSGGPYIFTYSTPASNMTPVPPPYLLVDLSRVHPRAFGEMLSAFREQVKREDITDQARIETLRNDVLQIILRAADWIDPMRGAVRDLINDIIHTAEAHDPREPAGASK